VVIRYLALGNAANVLSLSSANQSLTIENNWFGVDISGANDGIVTGVNLNGDGSTIGGPTGGEANVFANASSEAIAVAGDNNTIQGNLIGVKADGTTSAPNADAIKLLGPSDGDPATGTIVGGTQPTPGSCTGPCNVIANSTAAGILLQSGSNIADATTITGNFIGLDQNGALAANTQSGVFNANAADTIIGGPAAGQRNYISGGGDGISAAAQGAPGLEVRNNFIGVAPAGTSALGPPTNNGVYAISTASSPALITGNRIAVAGTAYAIQGVNSDPIITTGATISNNIIGLGTGNEDLGGGDAAIRASNLDQATITGNTITNFTFAGVSLEQTDDATVTGNRFGTDPAGGGNHAGNASFAVVIADNPAVSTGNTIGGVTAASENVISNTQGSPIVVRDGDNDHNNIGRNRGTNNAAIFIDVGEDGVGNGAVDAPNNGIEAPAISSATDDLVAGVALAGVRVIVFRTPDSGSPKDISSFVASTAADGAGTWQAPVNVPNGARLTALQTDASGDSSELSTSLAAVADPPETTITSRPRKRSRLRRGQRRKRVSFGFGSSEPGEGGFECRLDSQPFVECASPFMRRVRPGRHTFGVRAIDDAGNPDPSLAAYGFRVLRPLRRR
jgi:hypothetical protein